MALPYTQNPGLGYPIYNFKLSFPRNHACQELEKSLDYLLNLWTIGHITWAQAFRIKEEKNINRLKLEALSMHQEFSNSKNFFVPDYCKCFSKGISYDSRTPHISRWARSPGQCQLKCHEFLVCFFWTYDQHECKMFGLNDGQEHKARNEYIISGPKNCPYHGDFWIGFGIFVGALAITAFFCFICKCRINFCPPKSSRKGYVPL